jgi:hypothetical protein
MAYSTILTMVFVGGRAQSPGLTKGIAALEPNVDVVALIMAVGGVVEEHHIVPVRQAAPTVEAFGATNMILVLAILRAGAFHPIAG